MSRETKDPSFTDSVYQINCVDKLTQKIFRLEHLKEPLEICLVHAATVKDENLEVAEVAYALEATPPMPKLRKMQFEEIGISKQHPPPFNMQAPILELTHYPYISYMHF